MIRVLQKNLEIPDKLIHYFVFQNNKYKPINKDNFDLTDKTPVIFRGMAKSGLIKLCVDNNIDFYYIDTGYINQKIKIWHRFTKNNFQVLNHLSYEELTQRMNIKKLKDRFLEIVKKDYNSFKPELKKKGHKILITPPTNKVFKHFNYNVDKWIAETYNKIKKVTDREIVVRYKPKARSVRVNENPFLKDLNNNVHCLVTFNSITAIEAIINGCPAITLGPNAASYLTENNIDNIENPYYPDSDKIREHILYLTTCQFKKEEFLDNSAIETVNALQHDQKYLDFKL
jgi:uncharacterized membrane protein YjdF